MRTRQFAGTCQQGCSQDSAPPVSGAAFDTATIPRSVFAYSRRVPGWVHCPREPSECDHLDAQSPAGRPAAGGVLQPCAHSQRVHAGPRWPRHLPRPCHVFRPAGSRRYHVRRWRNRSASPERKPVSVRGGGHHDGRRPVSRIAGGVCCPGIRGRSCASILHSPRHSRADPPAARTSRHHLIAQKS